MEEENPRAIISPADGKIIKAEMYLDEEYRMEESQIVSIFMNVFDVHVNRYPVKGKVEYVNYKKGSFWRRGTTKLRNLTSRLLWEYLRARTGLQ
jgi:phosphatidylserine decarboxylase